MYNTSEARCPKCQQTGYSIDHRTLKALLKVDLRNISEKPYYFCAVPECDIVYFNENQTSTFVEHDLTILVYAKHPRQHDVLVCCCFGYTVHQIEVSVSDGAGDDIINAINEGIRGGKSACHLCNPEGRVCLGNVIGLIRVYRSLNLITSPNGNSANTSSG